MKTKPRRARAGVCLTAWLSVVCAWIEKLVSCCLAAMNSVKSALTIGPGEGFFPLLSWGLQSGEKD